MDTPQWQSLVTYSIAVYAQSGREALWTKLIEEHARAKAATANTK
jgi:hypothetical protein